MQRTMELGSEDWNQRVFWNNNTRTYGKVIKISRNLLIGGLIFLCLVTPATNWMIPFLNKAVKTGITLRYGQ